MNEHTKQPLSEMEKMQFLLQLAESQAEKDVITGAIETLRASFHALIFGASEAIKHSTPATVPLADAHQALQQLHRLGKQYGVAFPQADTPRDVRAYLVRWGTEMMH